MPAGEQSRDVEEVAYGVVGDFQLIGATDGVKSAIDASTDGGIDANPATANSWAR